MKTKNIITGIGVILISQISYLTSSFAQDIHLSQFNACPQNLNPSQTGLFNGDWRFVGNQRRQWAAVPVPYQTFSISTDTRLKMNFLNGVPALGLIINT